MSELKPRSAPRAADLGPARLSQPVVGRGRGALAVLALSVVGLSGRAEAQGWPEGLPHPGKPSLMVCYPGGAVKASQALPAVKQLATTLVRLGGATGPIEKATRFLTDVSQCRRELEGHPPILIASLALYLEHAESNHLLPLVRPKVGGVDTETWHLVVKKGRATDLAGLKGGTLGGTAVAEPELLERLLFTAENTGGQVADAGTFFKYQAGPRPLSQLKALLDGGLDAVLLTRAQHAALAALPFADQLQTLWTSPALPLVGVLVDTERTTAAERADLQRALLGVCADAEGAPLCQLFGLERFEAVDAGVYAEVAKAWARHAAGTP